MGWTCGTYGGDDRCIHALVGKLEGRNHLKDAGVNGRKILKWTCERLEGGMDWINLAQDGDRWRALVNKTLCPLCSGIDYHTDRLNKNVICFSAHENAFYE
jgi:hypothetical protein